MRTLRQLSEEILRAYRRGPAGRDEQVDLREIARMLRDIATAMIPMTYFENRTQDDDPNINSLLVATYTLTIQNDSRTDRNYADIPEYYVKLPMDRGVQRIKIWTKTGIQRTMIPLPYDAEAVIGALQAGSLSNRWSYSLQSGKAWFGTRCGNTLLEEGIKNVDMDIVIIPPAETSMDSPFPLPPDMWMDAKTRVIELMQSLSALPDDKDNDNQSPPLG